jgi:hypothetical protein
LRWPGAGVGRVDIIILARDRSVLSAGVGVEKTFGVRSLGISADVSRRKISMPHARIEGFFTAWISSSTTYANSETIAPDEKWNHFWDLHVMAAIPLSRAIVRDGSGAAGSS